MAKAARVSASVPVSAAASQGQAAARSNLDTLLSILLFSAFGLLISVGVLLLAMPLIWD
jgi:hypothetical protein